MTEEEKLAIINEIHILWDKSEMPEGELKTRWFTLTWADRLEIVHAYIFENGEDSFVGRHYAEAILIQNN